MSDQSHDFQFEETMAVSFVIGIVLTVMLSVLILWQKDQMVINTFEIACPAVFTGIFLGFLNKRFFKLFKNLEKISHKVLFTIILMFLDIFVIYFVFTTKFMEGSLEVILELIILVLMGISAIGFCLSESAKKIIFFISLVILLFIAVYVKDNPAGLHNIAQFVTILIFSLVSSLFCGYAFYSGLKIGEK